MCAWQASAPRRNFAPPAAKRGRVSRSLRSTTFPVLAMFLPSPTSAESPKRRSSRTLRDERQEHLHVAVVEHLEAGIAAPAERVKPCHQLDHLPGIRSSRLGVPWRTGIRGQPVRDRGQSREGGCFDQIRPDAARGMADRPRERRRVMGCDLPWRAVRPCRPTYGRSSRLFRSCPLPL